jgi:acetyltransferase-like isoleucine patch superfamily enzyme
MKRNLFVRIRNRFLHTLARTLPGATTLRPFLHKLRGVKIAGRVFIGDDVYLENEYPDHVEIHAGAQIALRSTIVAHIRGPGRIVIGKNVVIGFGSQVVGAPGRTLTIGDNAVIAAGSVITTDIPPNTFLSGERLKARGYITVPLTLETSYEDFTRGLRPLSHRPQTPL